MEAKEVIELYYGDESGFCKVPVVARSVAVSRRANPHHAAAKQRTKCLWVFESGRRGADVELDDGNYGTICGCCD